MKPEVISSGAGHPSWTLVRILGGVLFGIEVFTKLYSLERQIRCQHGPVPLRALLLACRQLPSCHVFTWWREQALVASSTHDDTDPIIGAPCTGRQLTLTTLPKGPTSEFHQIGGSCFHYGFEGTQNFSPKHSPLEQRQDHRTVTTQLTEPAPGQ